MFDSERPIIQIAYAVDDIKKSAEMWSNKFKIGPFYVNEHIKVENVFVNGEEG